MMKILKTAVDMIKVFLLFTGFTVLFYYAMIWINSEYENYHRYDQPDGAAIKVASLEEDKQRSWFDRLIFFYLNGE
ncbi:YqzK family protein [Bacillus sp. CLL-7-23]|uniref:YqzK family protein n=1 Tax=Bacillus changyiensis TaxID=3004103 RepID=A0ABT4X472_9BACI|nr:YqzK family protein [Bacillus changyiensis]MDA7027092.1 YqzK family protein [Bacillus changyiensis]